MRKVLNFFAVSVGFFSIFGAEEVFSRETRRSSKISKVSDYKNSSGLRVNINKSTTDAGTVIKCGQNAKLNAAGTACECLDAANYVVNTLNPTECFQKTDPVVVAQKKACGNALLKVVERECENSFSNNGLSEDKSMKCYDANDLFLKLNTSDLTVFVDGVQYAYDKVCYIYVEDLTKSFAENYAITGLNSPNCKLKRVVAEASNECFQAVLAAGKAYGATKNISSDLQRICGYTGLHAKWSKLFGTDDSSVVDFPKNIPDLYLHAGKLSAADGVALAGNFLDGKITDKSNEWELQITQILNSHLKEVGAACGKEYEISTHQVNFQLSDDKSSLSKSIDENGILKGGQEWAMKQASVFIGEKKANDAMQKGMFNNGNSGEDSTTATVIKDVENFDNLDIYYTKLEKGGIFVLVGTDEYSIIEVKNNKTGGYLEYEFKTYSDKIDLSKDALKSIIGKTEKILKNGRITKGE